MLNRKEKQFDKSGSAGFLGCTVVRLTALAVLTVLLLSSCGLPVESLIESILPESTASGSIPSGGSSTTIGSGTAGTTNATDLGNATESSNAASATVPVPSTPELLPPELSDTLKNRYYISQLDAQQQINFSQLYDAVMNFRDECRFFGDITEDDVSYLFFLLLNDCPEAFQLDDVSPYTLWTYAGQVSSVSFHYVMDEADYQTNLAACQTVIDQLAAAAKGKNDLEKELLAYNYLVENCHYDAAAPYSGTAYGALVTHRAKCDGFSRAMLMLAEAMNLKCMVITGSDRNDVGHAWNCISIDGQFYHLDVTADAQSLADYGVSLYPAFNIPAAWMLRKQTISDDILTYGVLPEADSLAQNYHTLHGGYIPAGDPYEPVLDAGLARLESENPIAIFLQFERESDYESAYAQFAEVIGNKLQALNVSASYLTITSDTYCLICVTVDVE